METIVHFIFIVDLFAKVKLFRATAQKRIDQIGAF